MEIDAGKQQRFQGDLTKRRLNSERRPPLEGHRVGLRVRDKAEMSKANQIALERRRWL
jgi:hypothetical protein